MILDIEWVPTPGAEARTATECFTRLAPHVPGAQGIVYGARPGPSYREGAGDRCSA